MEIRLQTRGVTHDYAFLGTTPEDSWWTIPLYKDATSFEQPTLILERLQGNQWRCFISGIPSSRRDRVETRIRYSMALKGNVESDQGTLFKLLAYVLDIFKNNPVSENNRLTKLLDGEVKDYADEWLGGNLEQANIHLNELEKKFVDMEPCSVELPKLSEELRGILKNASGIPSIAAILNFIGGSKEPLVEHLQSQMMPSQGKILILPSPIAGGQFTKFFILSPPFRNLTLGSDNKIPFPMGLQGDNPTTEGHDTTRQSIPVRNVKPKSRVDFYGKALTIAVILIVVLFLIVKWYNITN
ncbi:hypothetical protein HKD24_14605 [Gluconobacter sp. LMG 31484]|uniref:Uncharacterized protein n=1 Tax=Gluconobacter vitians TaxID=2728102 RepID=A0ABR9Y994_9PROT|nr:hypothetical protein [Gluconobacter vitians]MBF0860412.1 hypothetical protein [Gluconobacter vitians]